MENTTTQTESDQILAAAYRRINKRYRVLAPAREARIIWREFDPCHAVQAIATVEWPATVSMRDTIISCTIMDGEAI